MRKKRKRDKKRKKRKRKKKKEKRGGGKKGITKRDRRDVAEKSIFLSLPVAFQCLKHW